MGRIAQRGTGVYRASEYGSGCGGIQGSVAYSEGVGSVDVLWPVQPVCRGTRRSVLWASLPDSRGGCSRSDVRQAGSREQPPGAVPKWIRTDRVYDVLYDVPD